MSRYLVILSFLVLAAVPLTAQDLPHVMTPGERLLLPRYNQQRLAPPPVPATITPPATPVRTIAEWEELQGLLVTWTSYTSMVKEIIRFAKEETRVYVVCSNPATVMAYLASGTPVDTVNVTFIQAPFNSVWCRDYGPWSAYTNDVDSLVTIDWIYNRPRPLDDVIPGVIAATLGTPLYQTTTAPWDLVHTGGNFMTDGFGTGFSSNLILTDNSPAGGFNVSHTAAEIDTIMNRFMGIDRYIRMNTLPFDQIHHIDMHMKLLDEETLLVGEYPPGVADGPQIEANLQYILANYNSVFGTPYKVVRIPMPPSGNGNYPPNANYYTYTNSSFINKTVIVPVYNLATDAAALATYRQALPGYKVVGINSNASIPALGALHCITKELGTDDPLLISHQPLPDTYDVVNPYGVEALMKHRSGIATAFLHYTTDTAQPYIQLPMSPGATADTWTAAIPAQPAGTEVFYYVEATAVSGKQQVRPLPAPAGYWHFHVLGATSVPGQAGGFVFGKAFPNPATGLTCVPVTSDAQQPASLCLRDPSGRTVRQGTRGNLHAGENKWFIDVSGLAAGPYLLTLLLQDRAANQLLMVH